MEQQKPEDKVNPESNPTSSRATVFLGGWNFYFLAKFLLFWREVIGFHPLENLAFAAFLLFPVKSRFWRRVKQLSAVLLAVALLYYDSWLPSIGRAVSQVTLVSTFDASYLMELAGRFVNVTLLAMLAAAWFIYRAIAPWVRIGLVVVGYMAAMSVLQLASEHSVAQAGQLPSQVAEAGGKPDLEKALNGFYAGESVRSVSFPAPSPEAVPFDVIFIHVCSLSWDDVRAVGLDQHPLWKRFDFLFTNFNSAASYSGPAAIRIQRATCGQSSNKDLYQPAADECYLMGSLKRSGFEPHLAMNHDGHFDDFLQTIQAQHLDVPPMPLDGVAVTQHAFDGAPIYDDYSVLSRWLENRQRSGSSRAALYYNTISLHDGNRLAGTSSTQDSMDTYKLRLSTLLDGIEKFMAQLDRSGRRAVVAMIPEHGAAVQGDKMQIPGLREIPSPRITLVPVGIKIVGEGGQRQGDTLKIESETSYLAVTRIVARMMEVSPYTGRGYTPADYVDDLPVTPFVSQNDSAVVMRNNGRYYWRQNGEAWSEYF
ncbi:MAG TPA: cellulose biosynthesis protein BcsG [Gallionella sp.]|nr:cellulose biosynthesis protein BcsG [Gallionella sp.]